MMPKLDWITDTALDDAITKFRQLAHDSLADAERRQRQNVVDPFLSLMIASTFGADTRESLRQLQNGSSALRGMANALGYFHQEVLGGIEGWVNHDAGYDLECESRQLLAEVKNKHNTMNAPNRLQVTADLDTAVRQKGRGWVGYLVVIIPKHPERYEIRIGNARPVFEIDGASFYHKATGDPNALHDLFDVLSTELDAPPEIADYCRGVMTTSIPARMPAR